MFAFLKNEFTQRFAAGFALTAAAMAVFTQPGLL
jgi:hypothetical protein